MGIQENQSVKSRALRGEHTSGVNRIDLDYRIFDNEKVASYMITHEVGHSLSEKNSKLFGDFSKKFDNKTFMNSTFTNQIGNCSLNECHKKLRELFADTFAIYVTNPDKLNSLGKYGIKLRRFFDQNTK